MGDPIADDRLQNKTIEAVKALTKESDDLQKQVWIISGVFGAVALVLIIIVIWLAITLNRVRKQISFPSGNSGLKTKPVGLERTLPTKPDAVGNLGDLRHAPPHSFAQVPQTFATPAEQELAQLGFSAYTGNHMDSRGIPTSPAVSNSGGVRVLPRNPPTGFRNAAAGAYNDGYM